MPPTENTITAAPRTITGIRAASGAQTPGRQTFFGSTDMVFPHLATGGGWATTLVLVNMSATAVTFTQGFYDTNGQPLTLSLQSVPSGDQLTTSSIQGTIPPGASFNIKVLDQGTGLKTGWSVIAYDSTNARLGGYAIFRQSITNTPDFEALVPLSAYDDYVFMMPYDNMNGFVTSMALVNPATNTSNQVFVTILDIDGNNIGTDTISLAPGQQLAFAIPDRFAVTQGKIGSILFECSTNRLAGLGFRFNPGHAFATIPIMNWAGLLD
ncbi:hypothetical protein [uncultured Paludibaculum sp.]|uniref:hypothetical protein n=1 Tax=uncultured Paludibaculum sp. TaxID=1765020 RepID=UPI002AAB4513|nr:hypothetical protein [uncultured Paludibaculum sp.]